MTTKTTPKPSEVAKLRRNGATWQQVRDRFDVKTSSGAFTKALNEAGYDAAGLKLDGSGPRESKASRKPGTVPGTEGPAPEIGVASGKAAS